MDYIKILGMRFFGHHGVFEEERKLGQAFVVNTVLHLDLTAAGQSDRLADSINYAEVFTRVQRQVEGPAVRMLERLAQRIADDLLDAYPLLAEVEVEIEKPGAPIPGTFAHVSVGIARRRRN